MSFAFDPEIAAALAVLRRVLADRMRVLASL